MNFEIKEDSEIWTNLVRFLEENTDKAPKNLDGILFLIGVQELGKGPIKFTKEEKQDLMHIAICKILSLEGYYKLVKIDKDGWPHWKLLKNLPHTDILKQEDFLRYYIIKYFKEEIGLDL